MTVNYFSYDASGKIIWRGTCPESMVAAQGIDGLTAAIGDPDPATHYAPSGDVKQRPANPTTLNGMMLEGVPIGATVRINQTNYIATEPSVELSFDYPGTYEVAVMLFPYLDATWTVTK